MKKRVFKYIFITSFLYYVIWIGFAAHCAFAGVDSGWAMSAMSRHEMIYGKEAFINGITIGLMYTISTIFWIIPLYQILYIMIMVIRKIKNSH